VTKFIEQQLILIAASYILGIVMSVVYDIFRVARRFFKLGYQSKIIGDFVYWIVFSGVAYFVFLTYNYGGVRLYAIGVIFSAMFMYHFSVSNIFVNYCVKALIFVSKPIKLMFRVLKRKRGHMYGKWTAFREKQKSKTKYSYFKGEPKKQGKEKK